MKEMYLPKAQIGEFFSKMYEMHKGADLKVSLLLDENKISIYHRMACHFIDIILVDSQPNIEEMVKSITEKDNE